MKTFKKSLCLVLALVMVLGLCMVGANAGYEEYTDIETVKASEYADAINFVTDLGYMQGSDGAFAPEETLTRAQAAKLITGIVLGDAKTASALENKPYETGFEDVAKTHWAAGYIAFCKSKGIINGLGNGKFAPNDPVTGLQFAKMLLVACGYGANDEYVGEGWDIMVWTDAMTEKVLIAGVDTSASVTRAAAAQYMYNTLVYTEIATFETLTKTYYKADSFADNKGIKGVKAGEEVYGLIVANAASDGNKFGYTTVKLLNGTDFDATPVLLTGIAADEKLIGREVKLTYKLDRAGSNTGVCYTTADVSVDLAKLPTGKTATIFFENFAEVSAKSLTYGAYVQYTNGKYAFVGTDYEVGYVVPNSYVAATATTAATMTVKTESGLTAVEGLTKADENAYVKLYKIGDISKAEVLKTEVVTLTSVTSGTAAAFNGLVKANVSFQRNDTTTINDTIIAESDAPATTLNTQAVLVMVGEGIYARALKYNAPVVDSNEYVFVVAAFKQSAGVDAYNEPLGETYWAQCVTTAGEVVNYELSAAMAVALKGQICTVTEEVVAGKTYKVLAQAAASKTLVENIADGTKVAGKITKSSKTYYLSGASISTLGTVSGSGVAEKSNLKVTAGTDVKSYNAVTINAVVAATSYTNIYNVTAAWLTNGTSAAPVSTDVVGSYIYVANKDVANTVYDTTAKAAVNLYNFYVDGELVKGAKVSAAIPAVGFYTYNINALGQYVLTAAPLSTVITVSVKSTEGYVLNGKLNAVGAVKFDEADISALKIVDMRSSKDKAATVGAEDINSVDALTAAQMYYNVDIALVYTSVAGVNAPVGTLYVVGVNAIG